jgi:hypothetical protein
MVTNSSIKRFLSVQSVQLLKTRLCSMAAPE